MRVLILKRAIKERVVPINARSGSAAGVAMSDVMGNGDIAVNTAVVVIITAISTWAVAR